MIRPILKYGESPLHDRAAPVDAITPEVDRSSKTWSKRCMRRQGSGWPLRRSASCSGRRRADRAGRADRLAQQRGGVQLLRQQEHDHRRGRHGVGRRRGAPGARPAAALARDDGQHAGPRPRSGRRLRRGRLRAQLPDGRAAGRPRAGPAGSAAGLERDATRADRRLPGRAGRGGARGRGAVPGRPPHRRPPAAGGVAGRDGPGGRDGRDARVRCADQRPLPADPPVRLLPAHVQAGGATADRAVRGPGADVTVASRAEHRGRRSRRGRSAGSARPAGLTGARTGGSRWIFRRGPCWWWAGLDTSAR